MTSPSDAALAGAAVAPHRPVHNHGSEEGLGLACKTSPIGDCLRAEYARLVDELQQLRAQHDRIYRDRGTVAGIIRGALGALRREGRGPDDSVFVDLDMAYVWLTGAGRAPEPVNVPAPSPEKETAVDEMTAQEIDQLLEDDLELTLDPDELLDHAPVGTATDTVAGEHRVMRRALQLLLVAGYVSPDRLRRAFALARSLQ